MTFATVLDFLIPIIVPLAATYMVVSALRNGIVPANRGRTQFYSREQEPKRYWAIAGYYGIFSAGA